MNIRDNKQGEKISEINTYNWAFRTICSNFTQVSFGNQMSAMRLIIHQKLKDLLIFKEVIFFFVGYFICKKGPGGPVMCL